MPNRSRIRNRPESQVWLIADSWGLNAYEDGTPLSKAAAERLHCDATVATVATVQTGEGRSPLDVGRKRRTVPKALRKALRLRDRHCRFPGCVNRICDAHHVKAWQDGGETNLRNTALLCRRHHRFVHEGGARILGDANSLQFLDPHGRTIEQVPPPPCIGESRAPDDSQVDLDAAYPQWDGQAPDYEGIVDSLLQ